MPAPIDTNDDDWLEELENELDNMTDEEEDALCALAPPTPPDVQAEIDAHDEEFLKRYGDEIDRHFAALRTKKKK